MISEEIVQVGPMWILAGLGAGWLAETSMIRRGYGLLVDMALGVAAGLIGGGIFLASFGLPVGMFATFIVGFALASSLILAQRLWWPRTSGVQELKARLRLVELGRAGASSVLPGGGNRRTGRPMPTRALARMAMTGIYLLRGLPLELQRAARIRAVTEGTTLRQVLLKGLSEYAAGTWTPEPDGKLPVAPNPGIPATGR